MKDLAQERCGWRVIRIARHEFRHMRPPTVAHGGVDYGGPTRFILDLRESKKLVSLCMQNDRVVVHAVGFEHGNQFRPNRVVAALVFSLGAGMDLHDEGFANHNWKMDTEFRRLC